jgi:hypothetical protein
MLINTSHIQTLHWSQLLRQVFGGTALELQQEVLQFAEDKTFEQWWNTCPDGRWLLRFAGNDDSISRPQLVLAACACARLVLHLVKEGDDRPRIAIETAERWCHGLATIEEVQTAADAARAAVFYAATFYAINAADAAYAATFATFAVADARGAYHTVDAVYYAVTRPQMQQLQQQTADIVRSMLPIPAQLITEWNRLVKLKAFW